MLNAIIYKNVDPGPSKGGEKRHVSVLHPEISLKTSLLWARDEATMNFKHVHTLMKISVALVR